MNCNWGWAHFWFPGGSLFWVVLLLFISAIAVWKIISPRPSGTTAGLSCYHCHNRIEYSYLRCPHCGNGLKGHCPECSAIIETAWNYCPACSATLKGEDDPEK